MRRKSSFRETTSGATPDLSREVRQQPPTQASKWKAVVVDVPEPGALLRPRALHAFEHQQAFARDLPPQDRVEFWPGHDVDMGADHVFELVVPTQQSSNVVARRSPNGQVDIAAWSGFFSRT